MSNATETYWMLCTVNAGNEGCLILPRAKAWASDLPSRSRGCSVARFWLVHLLYLQTLRMLFLTDHLYSNHIHRYLTTFLLWTIFTCDTSMWLCACDLTESCRQRNVWLNSVSWSTFYSGILIASVLHNLASVLCMYAPHFDRPPEAHCPK